MNYSSDEASISTNAAVIAAATCNSVSILLCLLAVILVLCFRLLKKLVYRLAVYQVLSSLSLATIGVLQITLVNYRRNPELYMTEYALLCNGFSYTQNG